MHDNLTGCIEMGRKKYNQNMKWFKQTDFNDLEIKYGDGMHIRQSNESVVLDKKGAKKLIKELKGFVSAKN